MLSAIMAGVPHTEISAEEQLLPPSECIQEGVIAHQDDGYCEVARTQTVPTKSEEDEFTWMLANKSRPTSKGSTCSSEGAFSDTSDGQALAALTIEPAKNATDKLTSSSHEQPVGLVRRVWPLSTAIDDKIFQVLKPNYRPMNFREASKHPRVNPALEDAERPAHPGSNDTVTKDAPVPHPRSNATSAREPLSSGNVRPALAAASYGQDERLHIERRQHSAIVATGARKSSPDDVDAEFCDSGSSEGAQVTETDLRTGPPKEFSVRQSRSESTSPGRENTKHTTTIFLDQDSLYTATNLADESGYLRSGGQEVVSDKDLTENSKGMTATRRQPAATLHPTERYETDMANLMQVWQYKVAQHKQELSESLGAERDRLCNELQQSHVAKQALQEEINGLMQQRDDLANSLDHEKTRLGACLPQLTRLRNFMDGLGNDSQALRIAGDKIRKQCNRLAEEDMVVKSLQAGVLDELSNHAEKSSKLKDEALKTCHELHRDLQANALQNQYLERQLNEKVGLLAEERDRTSRLEQQAANVAGVNQSVHRLLKSTANTVLQKLSEMQGTISDASESKKMFDMIARVMKAIQDLNSQQQAPLENVANVKAIVETLSVDVSTHLQKIAKEGGHEQVITGSLQSYLDGAMETLRADTRHVEDLVTRNAAQRTTIATLRAQLEDAKVRVSDISRSFDDTRVSLNIATESKVSLEKELADLRRQSSSAHQADAQLAELRKDLNNKTKELEDAKDQSERGAEEKATLEHTSIRLQQQTQTIQEQLAELNKKYQQLLPEREQLICKAGLHNPGEMKDANVVTQHRRELVQQEQKLSALSNDYRLEIQASAENEIQKLVLENERLKSVTPAIDNESTVLKRQLAVLRHQAEADKASIALLKEQTLQLEVERKASSQQVVDLREAQDKLTATEDLEARLKGAQVDADNQKRKLQEITNEKTTLQLQIGNLERAVQEARSSHDTAKAQYEQRLAAEKAMSEVITRKLELARGMSRDAEARPLESHANNAAGSEQTAKVIKLEQKVMNRDQDLLQVRKNYEEVLSKLRAACRHNLNRDFQQELATALEEDQSRCANEIVRLEGSLVPAETGKQALTADTKRPSDVPDAEHMDTRRPSSDFGDTAQHHVTDQMETRMEQSSLVKFPTQLLRSHDRLQSDQPRRFRKRIDRNKNHSNTYDSLEVTSITTEGTQRARSDALTNVEPVNHNQVTSSIADVAQSTAEDSHAKPTFSEPGDQRQQLLAFSETSASDLRAAWPGVSQESDLIEEAQFDETPVSFAEFITSLRSSPAPDNPSSSGSLSILKRWDDEDHAVLAPGEFAIYEDHNPSGGSQYHDSEHPFGKAHRSTSSMSSTVGAKRVTPSANTGSKLVPLTNLGAERSPRRSTSSRSGRPKTRSQSRPEEGESRQTPPQHSSTMPGSSPDFVHHHPNRRQLVSTYQQPSGRIESTKHRSLQAQRSSRDPRLENRARGPEPTHTPQKRKSSPLSAEQALDVEHMKRAKRGGQSAPPASTWTKSSAAHPSTIKDLPSFPYSTSSIRRAHGVGRSRLHTSSGATARTTRAKAKRGDEMRQRFAEETPKG